MAKYFLVFLFFVSSARAQHTPVITLTAPIPILIESAIFVDSLHDDQSFQVVSPRLRIALLPRGVAVESDQYFSTGQPLALKRSGNIEYRTSLNEAVSNNWSAMPTRKGGETVFPYGGLLVDTTLKEGSTLVLEFRYKGSDMVLQRSVFKRHSLLPIVRQYRQKNQVDSVDNSIKSKGVKNTRKSLPGFSNLPEEDLVLAAGNHVEFLFKKSSLNNDSCIQYRLRKKKQAGDTSWKLTGHLLSLSSLPSGHSYSLEVKYLGMESFNSYTFSTLPFWYQRFSSIVLFIVSGGLLLTAVPYQFYRYRIRREKQKRLRVEEQLKTVQNQLNPHFVFNALSSIEALVTEGENERANAYLADFSDIMRDTLRNTDLLFISLAEDISMLQKYIRIEQLLFEFDYTIEIDPSLEPEVIEFPPMLLQPTIENAVKHGVSGMEKEGLIMVTYQKKNNDLVIIIEDNGAKKKTKHTKGNGKGMSFTRERIENLERLYKMDKMGYEVRHTEKGTTVIFHFQNWLSK